MELAVNGAGAEVDDRHAMAPPLSLLRDVAVLHGTKFGCRAGYYTACNVMLDGKT
jgi:aerobic-type carbon monoxide dehydrogenase small subunit (CoxS/CutS family)